MISASATTGGNPYFSGTWTNQDVTVTFACTDDLSGVASMTDPMLVSTEGSAQSVSGICTDQAGNSANTSFDFIQIDKIAPELNASVAPVANGAGWNNSDVIVTWTCGDALSGLNGNCPVAETFTGEGAGFSSSTSITDLAGNSTSQTVSNINIDRTLPIIMVSATKADSTPYIAGTWTNQSVTVHFTCTDADGSGVATCPADAVFASDGVTALVTGIVTDNADNSTSTSFGPIKIDKTAPTLAPVVNPNPVILNGTATVTSNAADGLSGLASQSCGALVTTSVGSKSVTCTATDNAGNTNSATVTYKVIYRFDGFLQPINDTAHQTCSGCPSSIFKGGSTVPVKFVLKDANGNVVQTASLPLWLTPVKGGSTSAAIDESVYSDPATSGSIYYWDGQQYHYNWSTKGFATGFFWRIGVTLDDGQTYYVYIGLR